MFFSLNKKFIYTTSTFFLFTSFVFIYTFYLLNIKKIQEEQQSIISRNQQYVELVYENASLKSELGKILNQNPGLILSPQTAELMKNMIITDQQQLLLHENKRTNEALRTYDERYKALSESFKIVVISSILFFLALLILWLLIRIWVLTPIEKLTNVSRLVLSGNYTSRLKLTPSPRFPDEFDELMHTFNNMLDNIENGIKEIQKTESFLQSIIDSIPDGIRVLDEDGTIIIANKEYFRQIGNNQNCIGQKCYVSSQNRTTYCPQSLFTCPLREILNKKAPSVKFIQQFAAYPNRHLSINAAPMVISQEDGESQTYIVEAIRDLSEDIDFSHQQKLSSLGFLSTSVAHEMKNHLGSIRMITEGLLNKFYAHKSDSDETKQYLTLVNKQLVECINVPERLLKMAQFSQEAEGKYALNNSIQDMIALLDYEAKRNGITITFNHPQKEVMASGNEADFKMLIMNLTQNAFKAMPNGGELYIKLSLYHRNQAKIEIKDTGLGIPADKLQRIFEPFYSQGYNTQNNGTGLGLAIVKSIIEKQRGEISVKSKPGFGTCFTIKIPTNPEK